MEKYDNLSGNSPVTHFQIEEDRISVWFRGNSRPYIYPEYKTGGFHLAQLQDKAISGSGLSAYITKNVKDKFIR